MQEQESWRRIQAGRGEGDDEVTEVKKSTEVTGRERAEGGRQRRRKRR